MIATHVKHLNGAAPSQLPIVALMLLVIGLLSAFLLYAHRSISAATEASVTNEARLLATRLESTLQRVDMTLDTARDH